MITIQGEKTNYGINFPTEVEELTPELLNVITENIKLPKHYCIVVLCFKTTLFNFVAAINSNRTTDIGVVPVLAKIYDEDVENVKAVVGDKIVIDRSSLERGVQLNLKTVISSNNARRYFNNDKKLMSDVIHNTAKHSSQNIIIIEAKIVPVVNVSASVDATVKAIDPFIKNKIIAS